MVVRKHRRFEFYLSDITNNEIRCLLSQVSDKAELLWYGFSLWRLVNSCFFHNICLADSTDKYYCELVVRVDQFSDMLYITYKETEK